MINKEVNSIPLVAVELEIDFQGYEDIAKNISRMKNIPKSKRENILARANKKISKDIRKKVNKLLEFMAYDKEVYRIAEIPYHLGPPKDEGLFITAIADYLLNKKNFN